MSHIVLFENYVRKMVILGNSAEMGLLTENAF